MKKAIIFAVIAFLVSAGGTTGFLVKTHKPLPAPAADSTAAKADSTREKPAAGKADSSKAVAVKPDSARKDSSQAVTKADSGAKAGTATQAAAPVNPPTPGPQAEARVAAKTDPVARAAAYKQVARVLSAMKPVEAAKVLAFLSDDEVEGLLRAVGPRQAADFLTNIPKERAAGLSRRLLVPKEPGR